MRSNLGRLLVPFAASWLIAAAVSGPALAQRISIDGRFSPAQTLTGPNYAIDASLGRQVGGNLFHSFCTFGLNRGESANFTGPGAVTNIIGRVTGGTASSIDGRIQSSIAGANLFLINPSGVVFGPNASVNVSGSFYASTADYIRLSDGARFQATSPDASTLSMAPPAVFGFLTAAPPALTVNGSPLGINAGRTLGLVGGPVSITGGAQLTAPAGTIHVTSAAGTGEVPVDPASGSAVATGLGGVNIGGGSLLDIGDPVGRGSGGGVFIRAGTINIDSSSAIVVDNYGAGLGGQLSLRGDSQIGLSNRSQLQSISRATGRGGDIVLTTAPGGGIIADNSTVLVGGFASGSAGQLAVTAGQLRVANGSTFLSTTRGSGSAGAISIAADAIVLDGRSATTAIAADTFTAATAGDLNLATGALAILANSQIATVARASGNAGRVSVNVAGPMSIDATGATVATGVFTQALPGSSGNASDMTIAAQSLSIGGALGALSASTFGLGAGGRLAVNVAGDLVINGNGILSNAAGIFSNAGALNTGNAGDIAITAGRLTIRNRGSVSSNTFGRGNAGNVSVTAGAVAIDAASADPRFVTGIATDTQPGTTGNAGTVTVSAGTVSLTGNGALISSSTGAAGAGGTVNVTVAGDMTLSDRAAVGAVTIGSGRAGTINVNAGSLSLDSTAQITSTPRNSGAGGAINVAVAGDLNIGTGALVTSSAAASGNAGSVRVNAFQLSLTGGGQIASTTSGTGAGGSVAVTVARGLLIDGLGVANTQIAASATGAQSGPGGSVSVSSESLTVRGGGQIASSTAGPGRGGDVVVATMSDINFVGAGPQITARSTGSGDAGSITVSARRLTMNGAAAISTDAATANGGNITLSVRDFLYLVKSEITTSVKGASGNGGNITIDPQLLVLDRSNIIAQAVRGHGGDITITAANYLASPDSIVSATSQLGISGTIEIVGPRVDLNGSLVVLSSELRAAAAVLRDNCAALGNRPRSSLVEAGRGGLPQDPETNLPALYVAGYDFTPGPHAVPIPTRHSEAERTAVRVTMHCR